MTPEYPAQVCTPMGLAHFHTCDTCVRSLAHVGPLCGLHDDLAVHIQEQLPGACTWPGCSLHPNGYSPSLGPRTCRLLLQALVCARL